MFLTVYVENVLPSEYGVRKPWYYIFQVCLAKIQIPLILVKRKKALLISSVNLY